MQVNKKNIFHRPSQWVYPTSVQSEDEFQNTDEIPCGRTQPHLRLSRNRFGRKEYRESRRKTGLPQSLCLCLKDWETGDEWLQTF